MLAQMHRSNVPGHGALVVTLAFAVLACTGSAPSAAAPSPRLTLTPTPSVDVGALYIKAVVAAFASDPLVMHVVTTEKLIVREGKESARLDSSMTLDLSGRDMNAHLTSKAKGKTTKVDLVVLGASAYVRTGGGSFRKTQRTAYTETFMNIAQSLRLVRHPSYLAYVGVETIDKRALQHLTATRDIPYVTDTGDAATLKELDIWVEEDGTPILAKAKVLMIGAYGREINATSEFRFSDFGGPISIVAPKN
jgi:hypothetical protein